MSGFAFMTSASAGVAALLVVLVFAGVVLPAVWSRKRARREAAAEVLKQLLDFFRSWLRR